jgi:hypothetical protein
MAQRTAAPELRMHALQRGKPAVAALNVFYHLTYEGAVDLEQAWAWLGLAAAAPQHTGRRMPLCAPVRPITAAAVLCCAVLCRSATRCSVRRSSRR